MAGSEAMNEAQHVQSPLMNVPRGAIPSRWSVPVLLSVLIGAIFIYAGALKAWDPLKFANDISNFHILSWPTGMRMAFYLPWLEIVGGVALITGRLRSGAVGILTVLTLIFIAATVAAKVRGINLDCGCFGSATKNLSFTSHLAIDLAILAGLVALLVWPSQRRVA